MGRFADANLAVRGVVGDINVESRPFFDRLEVDRVGEAPNALLLGEFGCSGGRGGAARSAACPTPGKRPPRYNSRRGNSWEYLLGSALPVGWTERESRDRCGADRPQDTSQVFLAASSS